jgi:hypothetical protein
MTSFLLCLDGVANAARGSHQGRGRDARLAPSARPYHYAHVLELERDDVDDCATLISDRDGPRWVAIRSVQETVTKFHRGSIRSSPSYHRVTKIDAFFIPHRVIVSRLNVKEVTWHRIPQRLAACRGSQT